MFFSFYYYLHIKEFNPIEYPPQSIVFLPDNLSKNEWLNRLKDYLKQDGIYNYKYINNKNNYIILKI